MSLLSFFTSNKKELSISEKTIKDFNRLKVVDSSIIYSSDMSVYKISSLCGNIIDYTFFIKGIINDITINNLIITQCKDKKEKEVSVYNFFLDGNNNYINVIKQLDNFDKICIEFLTLYEEKNSITNKDFITEKNLYLSSNIVNNVSYICKELINVFEIK